MIKTKINNFINKNETFIFFIIINILFLFIFVSTPIYNHLTYVGDTGIYQNFAKEMLNGKILYKELFDHKGPFIFFIYLITFTFKNINIGTYIIDLFLYNLIFYFNYKTIKIKKDNIINYILILMQFFMLLKTYRIISPESISLMTISYLNYWILSKQYLNPTKTQLIICGILTGIIFWIKFTLGIYIAVIYFYFIYIHIKNKTFNYKYILIPLIGFLIPTAIVFGYFIYNNALKDLIECYFIINTKYKNTSIFKININFILLIILNLSLLGYSIYKKNKEYLILNISYLFLIIPVFIMTKYNWNNLYTPFISLIPLLSIFEIKQYKKMFKYINIILSIIFVIIFLKYTLSLQASAKYNEKYKEFARDIEYKTNGITQLYSVDTILLSDLKELNYKYIFIPYLTYEQNPEMWEDIYNDVNNKKLEYIVLSFNDENKIQFNAIFLNSEKTLKQIEKINKRIFENYQEFKTYNEYKVYKRK